MWFFCLFNLDEQCCSRWNTVINVHIEVAQRF